MTTYYDHQRTPAERGDYWVAVHTWIFQAGLSHNALCTYIGLASFADRSGRCWPSLQAVADRMSLSRRTIMRGVRELEEAGLLTHQRRQHAGVLLPSVYQLRLTAPEQEALEPDVLVRTEDGNAAWAPAPAPDGYADPVVDAVPGPVTPGPGRRPGREDDHQPTPAPAPAPAPAPDPGPGPGAGRRPGRRGTRLPEDFTVTDTMRAWAADHAPDIDLTEATDRFRDYWVAVPGARGLKLDWTATWRNWIRTERRDHGSGGSGPRGASRQGGQVSMWDWVEKVGAAS